MAESNTSENNNETLGKVQNYFRENSKSLTIIGTAVVVLVGGYFLYNKFYVQKNEKKATEGLWKAEYYFEKDSFQLAVDGNMMNPGFKKIAKSYSGTTGGNIASYCMGISYLNLGKYKEAVEALEDCEFEDDIIACIAKGAQGDAYREMNKIDEAIEMYEEAADRVENQFTTPIYLKKAALAYEEKKNWKKAEELYQRIYDNYEHTTEGQDIEKYLAHARNLAK
ncbi:MAG TPA: tetratricopeptide repeat protein [Flavobacteriales bacterium]|nr:tetratricopeptide repeat protein [Flavobacteriales bacterium]